MVIIDTPAHISVAEITRQTTEIVESLRTQSNLHAMGRGFSPRI
jgi:hypothetical protein